jgi:16S rRNA (guanine966-N2)-methyltransferase
MRVTGGAARGVRLRSPKVAGVRPTTDRVRSALFNILARHGLEGALVADLYAGTGSVGIEALSRGAARADFVEADRRQAEDIRFNVVAAKVVDRANVLRADAEAAVERLEGPYDFVLMDPPYRQPFPSAVVERIGTRGLLAEDAIVVVGHPSRVPPPGRCGGLTLSQDRRYGDSSLAFYEAIISASEATA